MVELTEKKSERKRSWVSGIEQDISKHNSNKIIWVPILILSFLGLYFTDYLSDFLGMPSIIISLPSLGMFFIAVIGIFSSPKAPLCVAYYFYQIGYEIPTFEDENYYLKRNQKYIKDCSKQLKRSRNVEGYFTGNISHFFESLSQIMSRLNYVYSNESTTTNETFMNKRYGISSKLMELANLIYDDHENLTADHIKLTEEILDLLNNIPTKPFESGKSFMESFRRKWSEQPHMLKFIELSLSIFVVAFVALYQLVINCWPGNEPESAVVIAGSIAITVAFMNKLNLTK